MKGSSYNQNQKFNKLSGSKRRSRLNLGIADLPTSDFFAGSGDCLGTIEMVCSLAHNREHIRVCEQTGNLAGNVRCDVVSGVKNNSENSSSELGKSDILGTDKLVDKNRWKLLRRSKQLLAMRTVTPELALRLDLRRDWNLHRNVTSVLDCFPSLKHSYSSLRGKKLDGAVSILSNGQSARVDDIARSHSIRLDPVDSPKELYKYRQRIQKVIEWAYDNQLVPVMMTLTVYHRWHDLAPLCRVLRGAWSDLFARSKAGQARKEFIGLRGYIRRMEETFNDGDSDFNQSLNSGWHPHYHIILFVPRDRLAALSDYESELRQVWVKLVRKHFIKEFGEDIPAAFLPSFESHGLLFSRFSSSVHARKCGCPHARGGDLFEVKDGLYLAKVMGTDSPLYGGDSELTSWAKFSKTPFDLLKCQVTANLADLWCEYAIATKKIPCFTYSKGLQAEVDAYFESLSGSSASSVELPTEGLALRLTAEDYHWLYRHFLIGELLDKAAKGYDVAKSWLKDSFNIEVVASALPSLNDSADIESDVTPLVEESSKFVGKVGIKKALSVTNVQSVESVPIIRYDVITLSDCLNLVDFHSQNTVVLNKKYDYKNKAPP